MPARKLQKKFGTRKKPSSKKVTSSGRDLLGREKKRLQRIADLQAKYPNVSRDTIVHSMRYGKGKNPDQFQKSLIDSIKREETLKGIGKVAGTVGKYAMKGILPVTFLTELMDSKPAYYTGGKPVIKKKKKKKNKNKTYNTGGKIMVGYKAGGKV